MIALCVELGPGQLQHVLGTCPHAQTAALADQLIDAYGDFCHKLYLFSQNFDP
jgi:hypothetical protein